MRLYRSHRNSAGCFRDMLAATPGLRTLATLVLFQFKESITSGLWPEALRYDELRHFSERYIHLLRDMEVGFAALQKHVLPLADPHNFPEIALFKLCGFRGIRKVYGENEPRLNERANTALADLISRGVRVSIEE